MGNRGARKIISTILILAIILVAVWFLGGFALNKVTLNFNPIAFVQSIGDRIRGEAVDSEVRLTGSDKDEYIKYKDYIIKCSSNDVTFYDRNLRLIQEKSNFISSPRPATADKYMCVGDIGGKSFILFDDQNVILQKDMDRKISDISVSDNGYVTCVTDSVRGKNDVTVYDTSGKVIFSQAFTDTYVIGAMYNSSTGKILTNELDVAGGVSATQFNVFTSDGVKESSYIFEGDIFPFWGIMDNNFVYAYSERNYLILGNDNKERWTTNFTHGILGCAILNWKSPIIADTEKSKTSDATVSVVKILNDKGDQTSSYELAESIKNISVCDGFVCVNTGKNVYFINDWGWLMGTASSDSEIESVLSAVNGDVVLKVPGGVIKTKASTN
jgi:hypothetical protein